MKSNFNIKEKPLSQFEPGEQGSVERLDASPELSLKLMEMGIGPGEIITFIRKAPLGDPIEVGLMNYRLAIRKSEAEKIFLKPLLVRS